MDLPIREAELYISCVVIMIALAFRFCRTTFNQSALNTIQLILNSPGYLLFIAIALILIGISQILLSFYAYELFKTACI